MNAFDLRAIGWVVTRDAFVDIVRCAFGAPRRIEPNVLIALAEQWCAFEKLHRAERPTSPLASASLRGASPSVRSTQAFEAFEAFEAFVQRIVAEFPERYGPAALRRRWRTSLAQAGIGLLGSIALTPAAPAPDTLLANAALVLLVMGLWNLATSVQLWRTYRLVNGLVASTTSRT